MVDRSIVGAGPEIVVDGYTGPLPVEVKFWPPEGGEAAALPPPRFAAKKPAPAAEAPAATAEAPASRLHHLFDVRPLLGAAALQVPLRVRFGGGDQQADLVDAETGIEVGEEGLTLDVEEREGHEVR